MELIKSKKGIVFTVLSIVIAIFFTVLFSARIEKPIDYKTTLVETRIGVLNNYMNDFFEYAKGMSSITAYSSFQGLLEDMSNTSSYNPDFENQSLHCVITGNLTSSKICPGMANKTLTYSLNRIRDIADNELNINSDYTINNITLNQTINAFTIEITTNLSLDIYDEYANLSDTRTVVSLVSIDGLLDPLYLVNGTYNQTIKKTSLKRKQGDWNHSDLQQLYYNHEYRNYRQGISFINRIKGNFVPDVFGIESFVNHTNVTYDENDTMVDYLYWRRIKFSCRNPARVVEINDTLISPAGFQLDEVHRLGFSVSSMYTDFTCPQT
ncbi:hypothetical protein KY348_02090 [Candidatus Woesearchaeota archaeon]|nr:hypothetical protein [Candidatus Woesearchaeota archaeon]